MTVQQALEEALCACAGVEPTVHAAGRTDAGVHATGQVAHVDLPDWRRGAFRLLDCLNFRLRSNDRPVAILACDQVDDRFHARFSATERRYLYRILTRRAPPTLDAGHVWHVPSRLDAERMAEGAARLIGRHDFSSFRAAQCQASGPIRTLDALEVTRTADGDEIQVRARARSFLHHQVRNMVGTLAQVGLGRWSVDRVTQALEAKSRAAGGPTAPPDGLHLTGVGYEPQPAMLEQDDSGFAADDDE